MMTPLGLELRRLRDERGVTQKQMATAIGVSPAYLSALEHGKRGKPSWPMLQRIMGYFNVIWDEADRLQYVASISDPKVMIDTSELSPKATEASNLLKQSVAALSDEDLKKLIGLLKASKK